MNIKITGDLVVNRDCNIDKDLIKLFAKSDLNIINLEAPVTASNSKILKTGPHLKADETSTRRILKELNVDLVTLANNHVLDYGEEGVIDTLKFCEQNNIEAVGAGANLHEASKIFYIDSEEGRVGIVNFTENEWANATENSAGANPMDTIDNARQINEAKSQSDHVIVIVHGGHEYYNLPSPRMQKQYRYYVDCGADLIVGHHTHCISGFEIYNAVPIYYSLGNFLFTSDNIHDDWYMGLVLEVEVKRDGLSTKLHPVQQEKKSFGLSLIKDNLKNLVLEKVSSYSQTITSEEELDMAWSNFIELNYKGYINRWSPLSFIKNRYIKAAFNRLKYTGINMKGLVIYLNLMRCEAHADLSKEIIQRYLKLEKKSK